MFGKLMSISDELMWRYFELLSFRPLAEIAALRSEAAGGRNPRDIKLELARELVARFHDAAAAASCERKNKRLNSSHQISTNTAISLKKNRIKQHQQHP